MHQDGSGRGATAAPARQRRRAAAAGLLLGPLLGRAGGPAAAQDLPAPATLTVRGSAAVAQAPDLARMTVSVLTRGATLDAAVRGHTTRVAAARAVLARLAASGVTVDEGSFDLGEERPMPGPDGRASPQPATYRAETRFDLTLRPLDRLDGVVGEIAAAGLFELGSARFGVADGAGATDRARRAAMADARHQADVYAEAGGLRLDGIQRIADAEAAIPDGAPERPLRMVRAATVGITPPKALDFQAGVTVTWRVVPR